MTDLTFGTSRASVLTGINGMRLLRICNALAIGKQAAPGHPRHFSSPEMCGLLLAARLLEGGWRQSYALAIVRQLQPGVWDLVHANVAKLPPKRVWLAVHGRMEIWIVPEWKLKRLVKIATKPLTLISLSAIVQTLRMEELSDGRSRP